MAFRRGSGRRGIRKEIGAMVKECRAGWVSVTRTRHDAGCRIAPAVSARIIARGAQVLRAVSLPENPGDHGPGTPNRKDSVR